MDRNVGPSKAQTTDHYHRNRTDQNTASTVIEFSLDDPHLGQVKLSNQLWK